MQPELVVGLIIANEIYCKYGGECVVTAGSDGVHRPGSLHYVGLALDLRTRHLTKDQIANVARELREALGEEFDVVVEGDHIHLEFQPKGA